MSDRKDIPWIHLLRVIACMMVVCLHTLPPPGEFLCDGLDGKYRYVMSLLTKPCVPLFFMITGYLILPYKEQNFSLFYKKRIPRVLFPLLFWGVVYSVLPFLLGMYDLEEMFWELLLSPIKSPGAIGGILWYLHMLIGIYLIIPFISPAIYDNHKLMRLYLIIWVFSSILVIVSRKFPDLTSLLGNNPYEQNFDMTVYFAGYLGYLLLGVSVKLGMIRNMNGMRLLGRPGGGKSLLVIVYVLTAMVSLKLHSIDFSFLAFGTVVMTLCIFLLINDIQISINGLAYRLIKSLSKYSFGIYLSHMVVFRSLSIWLYEGIGVFWYIQVLCFVVTLVGAYLLTRLIALIPIKKYMIG